MDLFTQFEIRFPFKFTKQNNTNEVRYMSKNRFVCVNNSLEKQQQQMIYDIQIGLARSKARYDS